ncbi:LLM class flavin-dependent oxidoreductase [Nonomuraea sp. NPDC059194]|uniref:LLM class flavin-dependent oxidoreductase n=1 Tax=Nonomuraea sp. NPDC059194 TaxID=3346764 RepID=UPI0036CF64F9
MSIRLPSPCVIVLVGPGACGKSTWAATHFPAGEIVSSDRLRSMVGEGEDDIAASSDALALLETVVSRRIARRLTTVIDTLGLDAERRRHWRELARAQDMPCVAVAFDTPVAECRARNRSRSKRIPAEVLAGQFRAWARTRDVLADEGFDQVLTPEPVRVVAPEFLTAQAAAERQSVRPVSLRFGLHLGRFDFTGGAAAMAPALRQIAEAAESAGFDAIYTMDHFRQIPQLGRPWEDFPESYTTLAYLAGYTERVRLGTLVSGITYRNVAHLGKTVATLDVLSQGRAVCGLGLAWFRDEHRAYGWDFPSVPERYALLEDALRLLPVLWGPGAKPFKGKVLDVPEAMCYPRPLQKSIPIIVGGGGEKRTLRLAAMYGAAANVMGDLETVRRKARILGEHCRRAGRDVRLTHLSTVLAGADAQHVADLVDRLRPRRQGAARFAESVNAGTVADHIGRCRDLADAGVSEMMVRFADLTDPGPLELWAKVIAAFR